MNQSASISVIGTSARVAEREARAKIPLSELAAAKGKDRIKQLKEEADRGQLSAGVSKAVEAAKNAGVEVALGSVGAGLGATTVNFKGGIGSASAQTRDGITVAALCAANAAGSIDHLLAR